MVRRRTVPSWACSALAVAAAACAPNATQSSLEPAGPYAEKADSLFVPVFWVAVADLRRSSRACCLLFAIRYRHRKGRSGIPSQIHGNTRLEVAWTILPAVILAGVAVPTVATIWELAAVPEGDVLEVNVLGHQWWWEFDYPDQRIITANELHIPTGKPVYLTLCAAGFGYGARSQRPRTPGAERVSARPTGGFQPAGIGASVIHSFWVPALAGTTDVIPNQTNHMTIQADEPGTYRGNARSSAATRMETCGSPWSRTPRRTSRRGSPASRPRPRRRSRGATRRPGSRSSWSTERTARAPTVTRWSGWRTRRGDPLLANGGPNLTHFASRTCFAGCILETNEENLRRWLDDPQAVKYGAWMPEYDLTDEQIDQLIAYLLSLT